MKKSCAVSTKCEVLFDLEALEDEKIEILQEIQADPNIWQDAKKSKDLMKRSKEIEDVLESFYQAERDAEDLQELFLIAQEDESMEKDLEKEIALQLRKIDELKLETMLDGPYDNLNVILSIHAGSGGLDAQDWAQMLLRMYLRFASDNGFKANQLDINADPAAGIKSVTLQIEGKNAYGFLKAEKGVHRIVRISPFDPSGKRHTSFASVDIIPELDDSTEVEIRPQDLRIDTYRASGAGGQHVNKTESAVRITHLPTNIVVQSQSERSQLINKDMAMKMLKGKLVELKEQENKEKIEDLQGEYSQIGWGNQIRSYVFQPYTLVKDHRTGFEIGNITQVIDGEIMPFILDYLKEQKQKGKDE